MKKKLLAIALIASLTAGSALQAKKKAEKPADKRWYTIQTIMPDKPITDPKKLNKQIRNVNGKIRKTVQKRNRYFADRTRAANKGDQKAVNEFTDKIRHKNTKIVKHIALLRMYTLRLAAIKAAEIKKDKAKKDKPKKAKKKKAKKVKTKREKTVKAKNSK